MGSRKIIRNRVEGRNIRNRTEDSRGMRSHNRAIHNNRAIPSRLIRNREMGSSRVIRPKVEGIKDILSRGMSNSRITRSKVEGIKVILSRDTLNKDIPSKVMHNKDTGSNRAMDNHLPGMLRPKKRRP